MPVIDFDMETDMGTARDSLMATAAALSVSNMHEGRSPWVMISSVIAALEALLNASGAIVVPKFRVESLPIVASTAAQDMDMVLPDGTIVLPGSFIKVITLEATGGTKTVDIGISGGDENGFIAGLSVAAAGSILPTLADGAQTVGDLNKVDESSGDLVPEGYACTAATTLCYSLGDTDFAEMVAELHLCVLEP
jgi:hypothetical protein